jgi:hypothetical protein
MVYTGAYAMGYTYLLIQSDEDGNLWGSEIKMDRTETYSTLSKSAQHRAYRAYKAINAAIEYLSQTRDTQDLYRKELKLLKQAKNGIIVKDPWGGINIIRDVSRAAVDHWGIEAQMLMVAEEAIELSHAILKWRRAWKKYNRIGASLTRDDDPIESKAYQRTLEKRIKNVQKEAMQLFFMLDQLQVMLPGDYESILEEVINDCADLLHSRGVAIPWYQML